MWSNHSVLIYGEPIANQRYDWFAGEPFKLVHCLLHSPHNFITFFLNSLVHVSASSISWWKMYIQCYSPVKIWAPPNRASNLHCFLLLGVRDSKINGAAMQPKWLCLQICSTFQEKNIEKDHVFSTSLSWKSTLRASVHLRDFVTFSAPRCSRLPAANVDMPRCRCDFPRRPGKCLSLISHGSRLLTTLYKRHVLFSCDDEVCLAGNAVWSNENCAKIPRFWQIWITLTSIHSVCCVSSRAFLSQAVEFSRDFCLEIFKLNFCDQLDQLDQLIPAFCCCQIISQHTTILWIFAWYRCLLA